MKNFIKDLDKTVELIFYILCVPVLIVSIKWSIEDIFFKN